MANNLLTISKITNEALMVLENELTFTSEVNRDYDDQFAVVGAKIGNTVNVRRPGRFIGTTGPALNVEDFNETSIPVVLGQPASYGAQFHVDTQFTTQDLALSLDLFSDRVLKPCVAAIANFIDYQGLQMAKNSTANIIGIPGTAPTGLLTYLQAAALLDSEGAPRDGRRSMVVEQFTSATIVDSLKGLFVPQTEIGEQYKKGLMGRDSGGLNWYMDQNVAVQNFGYWNTAAGAITVTGAGQGLASGWASSSNITMTATQALTFAQGDTFTIAGVQPVNPQNRKVYGSGRLRPFVVNAVYPATTVGVAANTPTVVNVSPALIYGGQFQNCSASPSSGAVITPTSMNVTSANSQASPQNIMMHRNAFTFATADLELPEGVHFAGRASDKEIGLSIRVVRQYTINNDAIPTRLDVLFGWAPLYQELACRVTA